jgi:hypothetical protein
MIILGAVLAIVGALAGIGILLALGVVLIVVGLVLNFVPMGAGPRRRYY